MNQGETYGINVTTNETNKHGDPNSHKIPFLTKYGFIVD